MAKVNLNYDHLSENYLFAEMAHRVSAWQEANPDQKLIRMGIGDVTRPIPGVVTDAMQKAAKELWYVIQIRRMSEKEARMR